MKANRKSQKLSLFWKMAENLSSLSIYLNTVILKHFYQYCLTKWCLKTCSYKKKNLLSAHLPSSSPSSQYSSPDALPTVFSATQRPNVFLRLQSKKIYTTAHIIPILPQHAISTYFYWKLGILFCKIFHWKNCALMTYSKWLLCCFRAECFWLNQIVILILKAPITKGAGKFWNTFHSPLPKA